MPEAGFEVRTRDAAAPQLERNVRRIAQYLTLVGLTALLVGGVGVANAVASHLATKRTSIATLKALGASRGVIFATYFAQVFALAAIGIGGGLVLGAALPFAASAAISGFIPFPLAPKLDPLALVLAALYGALVTLAFTLWPLARAQEAPVSVLFRDVLGTGRRRPPRLYMLLCAAAVLALAALAVTSAEDKRAALIFIGAAAGVFALLRLVASAIMAVAKRLPRPRSTMGAPRARQHPPPGRPHAHGGAVAWAWPVAADHHRPHRPQPDLGDHRHFGREGAELLLRGRAQ